MENLIKNKKLLAIAAAILVLIIGVFFLVNNNSSPDTSALISTPIDPVETILGRELLAGLQKMKSIKLDLTIFGDPVFSSLKDFSHEIPKQPIGRRNPFAPPAGIKVSQSVGNSGDSMAAGTTTDMITNGL
jgi:hypothetical protein